jgi:hypothetical protein
MQDDRNGLLERCLSDDEIQQRRRLFRRSNPNKPRSALPMLLPSGSDGFDLKSGSNKAAVNDRRRISI